MGTSEEEGKQPVWMKESGDWQANDSLEKKMWRKREQEGIVHFSEEKQPT